MISRTRERIPDNGLSADFLSVSRIPLQDHVAEVYGTIAGHAVDPYVEDIINMRQADHLPSVWIILWSKRPSRES
jgi:hypothetical protein